MPVAFNASLGDWWIGPPKHLAAHVIFQRFPFLKISEGILLLTKAGNPKWLKKPYYTWFPLFALSFSQTEISKRRNLFWVLELLWPAWFNRVIAEIQGSSLAFHSWSGFILFFFLSRDAVAFYIVKQEQWLIGARGIQLRYCIAPITQCYHTESSDTFFCVQI